MWNFAIELERLLWEYRQARRAENGLMLHYHKDLISQWMIFDVQGTLILHMILEKAAIASTNNLAKSYGITKVVEVISESPFYLLPESFADAQIPMAELEVKRCRTKDNKTFAFEFGETQLACHMAMSLSELAIKRSLLYDNYILSFIQSDMVTVFFFSGKELLLANNYPAENEAAALYFTLAPIKKAGLDVENTKIEILGNENFLPSYIATFKRFISDMTVLVPELPYQTEELPPYAAEASLIYGLATCALPAEH
jgi:hypothetical protein